MDAESNYPIYGAEILREKTGHIGYSDIDGLFSIPFSSSKETLHISHLNYEYSLETQVLDEQVHIIKLKSLTHSLGSSIITAFESKRFQAQTPGAIAVLSPSLIEGGDNSSLLQAANSIPGVKIEERGYGGSRRINIRGSFLRSPFAVRNISIYWEGIPMSGPDGFSPLEIFDNQDIGGLEIIKGPAASVYGAGLGGTLLFKGKRAPSSKSGASISSGAVTGEFGFLRINSNVAYSDKKVNLRFSHNYQELDGYREQEFNKKNQLSLFASFKANEKLDYYLYKTYYNGTWALPGSIKIEQVEEDPRQAQPFAKAGNSSVHRIRDRFGISQTWKVNEKLRNKTSLFSNSTSKDNPYGTSPFFNGYKDENASGYGFRSVFSYITHMGAEHTLKVNAGAEYRAEDWNIDEYSNILGEKGDWKYSNSTNSYNFIYFLSLDIELSKRTFINLGASMNQSAYDNEEVSFANDTILSLDRKITYGPSLLPRVGISHELFEDNFVHASVSYGEATPTMFEIVNTETGAFSGALEAENGVNYELGSKGGLLKNKLRYDASIYQFNLSNAILAVDDIHYHNAGATTQKGAEAILQAIVYENEAKIISLLELSFSGALNDYRFDEYVKEDTIQTGNYLPGTPLHTAGASLRVKSKTGFSLFIDHKWYDKTTLDDENEDWVNSYNILNAKLAWNQSFAEKLDLEIFVGGRNLLDTQYSSFLQINGVFGKYYNPSPGINYYGGLKLRWRI